MEETSGVPAIAGIAALIGDPARAEVLTALLADRALSATELAAIAGVAKSTISSHLEKLLRAGLVACERQGRHKYFRLSDRDVAHALESLMGVAWRTGAVRRPVGPSDPALRKARVCYDHLAGELGVRVYESLVSQGALIPPPDPAAEDAGPELTRIGELLFQSLDIDTGALRAKRRAFCRSCLDWSERRHHLAGALGAALLSRITELRWARRAKGSRALLFSALGEAALRLAIDVRGV
ncbi:MAG TPA: helix-turn-helix domain-containing protein [Thermoanaerobaculia bacterium]|jgi:DNA-binding transcriptional ArsR family regulator|nr:helix-turn-helix domain-containing protein [Thermoanaerobaculia bacterium]